MNDNQGNPQFDSTPNVANNATKLDDKYQVSEIPVQASVLPKRKFDSPVILFFLIPILYGLIPTSLNFVFFLIMVFTDFNYIPLGLFMIVLILMYFLLSLYINSNFPNFKSVIVISLVLVSGIIVYFWNEFTCAFAMLIKCDSLELYSISALFYSYFGHILSITTFFIGRKLIKK